MLDVWVSHWQKILSLRPIINLKKEAGMTSHDAVFKLRKILGMKKIGMTAKAIPFYSIENSCLFNNRRF